MATPNKAALAIILGMRPRGEEPEEPEGPLEDGEGGDDEGLKAAIEELLRAIKEDDVEAGAEAFRDAVDICLSLQHGEGDDSEEDEKAEGDEEMREP